MRETASAKYPPRTLSNADGADAMLVLGDRPNSAGCAFTIRCCRRLGKPYRVLASDDLGEPNNIGEVAAWLIEHSPQRLNIAGDRDAREGQL